MQWYKPNTGLKARPSPFAFRLVRLTGLVLLGLSLYTLYGWLVAVIDEGIDKLQLRVTLLILLNPITIPSSTIRAVTMLPTLSAWQPPIPMTRLLLSPILGR